MANPKENELRYPLGDQLPAAGTTLELAPEDLHEFGRHDLAEIDAEWREIARGAGYHDPSAYRLALDTDPRHIPTRPEALVERAAEQISRSMAAAPAFFGRLPAAPCEVRPVEAYKQTHCRWQIPETPEHSVDPPSA